MYLFFGRIVGFEKLTKEINSYGNLPNVQR